jgi:hypothetical protein
MGEWRAHNLPLPNFDDGYRASAAASMDEEEWLRVPDRIVRHLTLGHDDQLRALRNQMMDRILMGTVLEDAESLARLAATGGPKPDGMDAVFLGTEAAEIDTFTRTASARRDLLERNAEAWGDKLERLMVKAVVVRVAELDARTLRVGVSKEIPTLVIGAEDKRDHELRWRLGGLVMPG